MALAVPGSKGYELEEALKAYFWQAGYFVARGLPYRLNEEDVTDVDLWIYERPTSLTRRRLIVDAKSRRSPKVSERIIWVSGLRTALEVDGAIVATTDNRVAAKSLAKALNVILLAGDVVGKITQSDQLKKTGQLKFDDLEQKVKNIDETRRSSDWRNYLRDARASLISGLGVHSTNSNLTASSFFAEQAVVAQPRSEQAHTALRLFYLTSAFAAISLDFLLADQAFRSQEERRQSIIRSVRYGEGEGHSTLATVRTAIGLARKYAENGTAAAKQIEYGFLSDAERIPAEIIADYASRISTSDALFNLAREIERASLSLQLPSFDELSNEAKSLLGVFLDFNGISREGVAACWPPGAAVEDPIATQSTKSGTLFPRRE